MSKSVVELGRGQSHELCLKLEQAGLTRELAQEIINAFDNYLAKKIVKLIDYEVNDPASHFEEIDRFEIIVPENVSLECFAGFKNIRHDSYAVLSDKDFSPSVKLVPGQKMTAVFYSLVKPTNGIACLDFARKKGQLPNAQGLAAIQIYDNMHFGWRNDYLGLDEIENLPKNESGEPMVSNIGYDFEAFADKIELKKIIPVGYRLVVFE